MFGRAGRQRRRPAPGFDARGLRRVLGHLRRLLRRVDGRRRPARAAQTGSDLRYDLRITFEEAVLGTEKEIEFPVLGRCDTCSGSGAKPGTEPVECPQCKGRGEVRTHPPDDARPDGQRQPLPALPGRGQDRRDARARRATARAAPSAAGASGSRSRPASTRATRSGSRTRARSGRAAARPGSLYVAVHVADHPELTREGTELYYEADLSIAQAALGTKIRVPTVEGDGSRGRDQARHPARDRDPAPRPRRAAPAPARRRAATSTSSPTSSSRRS